MNKLLKQVFAVAKKNLFINLITVHPYIKKVFFICFYGQIKLATAFLYQVISLS
jgi:hypothetical protein